MCCLHGYLVTSSPNGSGSGGVGPMFVERLIVATGWSLWSLGIPSGTWSMAVDGMLPSATGLVSLMFWLLATIAGQRLCTWSKCQIICSLDTFTCTETGPGFFGTITAIHFSRALKVHTKTRSPSTNSLCFACWSCLSLVTTCLSYMRCCRSGWTLLSLVVSFLLMSSSAGDTPVVVYGVV